MSREIGSNAEKLAAEFLVSRGYKIIESNYFARVGEIDIIAEKDNVISFVEVKYRHRSDYGTALDSVTRSKMDKILKSARRYLLEHDLSSRDWQIDVVTVDKENTVELYENVYTEGMR